MNYWLLGIVILLVISPVVFATEIKTEKSTGKDGEPITTTYYEGESNDMVKRIRYGTGPKYRLEEQDFAPNSSHVTKVEYYDIAYGLPEYPHGREDRRITYFSDDQPDFIAKQDEYRTDEFIVTDFTYRSGIKGNFDHLLKMVNDKGQTHLIQTYYHDGGDNIEHLKLINTLFANGVLVGKDTFLYEGRSDYLSRDSIIYTTDDADKPESQRKTHNEGKDFYDNPSGLKRYVAVNEPNGQILSTGYFDKTKSKDGIEKMDEIRLAGQITNQVIFYGVLYKGRIAKSVSERGTDGLWYSRYFDAAGTEIQP